MTDRYLPVPVWNNRSGAWEPLDFRHGQKVVHWPEGFDPGLIPKPTYRDGDHVQFVRDETCAREGMVRMVLAQGGAYGPFDPIAEIIQQWYCDPNNFTYIVTARGHDHRIKEWNILGRFVSDWRR